MGDGLRESIDYGLANSRFGVVVLSPDFFIKGWPQAELDGLFTRELKGGKVILPVWHNLDSADVRKHSPIIASRLAARTSEGLDEVVRKIMRVVDPQSSYLISGQLAVAVRPERIPLGGGGWAAQTLFFVANKMEKPVFAVCIKAVVVGNEVQPSDLGFDIAVTGNSNWVTISGGIDVDVQMVALVGFDSQERNAIYLILNALGPKETKTLVLKNTRAVKGEKNYVDLEAHNFHGEPVPLLSRDGEIALPGILFKENVRVTGTRLKVRRHERG